MENHPQIMENCPQVFSWLYLDYEIFFQTNRKMEWASVSIMIKTWPTPITYQLFLLHQRITFVIIWNHCENWITIHGLTTKGYMGRFLHLTSCDGSQSQWQYTKNTLPMLVRWLSRQKLLLHKPDDLHSDPSEASIKGKKQVSNVALWHPHKWHEFECLHVCLHTYTHHVHIRYTHK